MTTTPVDKTLPSTPLLTKPQDAINALWTAAHMLEHDRQPARTEIARELRALIGLLRASA